MDPMSAIGLAGALVGIGDVITRSIHSLIGLQSKYRSSSLVVSLLIGQLTTLKAALNQISKLITGSLINDSLHEPLVDDLQVSLESCHVLIRVLEERIQGLERESGQIDGIGLTARGKAKFLWEESSLKELNNYLGSQVNALNLLLTALNCRTTFERAELLHSDESRQIFKQVEDNKTSLLSLRDADSQRTKISNASESSSLLDLDFDFDHEVLTTNVYRAAWRSSLKKDAVRKRKQPQRGSVMSEVIPEGEEPETMFGSQNFPIERLDRNERVLRPRTDHEVLERLERFGLRNEGFFDAQDDKDSDESFKSTPHSTEGRNSGDMSSLAAKPLELPPLARLPKTERETKGRARISRKFWPQTSNFSKFRSKLDVSAALRYRPASVSLLNHPPEGRPTSSDEVKAREDKSSSDESQSEKASTEPNVSPSRSNLDLQVAAQYQPTPATFKNLPPAEQKVLLLGGSESGKSTFLKFTKLALEGPYSLSEREGFKGIIFSNIVQSMRAILEAMKSLEFPFHNNQPSDDGSKSSEYHCQTILTQPTQIEGDSLPLEIGQAIEALWEDDGVRAAFNWSQLYHLDDNASYYFDSIKRIADHEYLPTHNDIIMAWEKTTDITETYFRCKAGIIWFFEHGGERNKWVYLLEETDVVIYHVDISAWDRLPLDDATVNIMQEDLILFDSIVNSPWFAKASFILHFTKMDKLEAKIGLPAFKNCFPEFQKDEKSLEDVKAHIKSRFLSLSRNPRKNTQVVYTSFINMYKADAALKIFDSIIGRFSET